MVTKLILVGKTTDAHIQALTDDYISRLTHYAPLRVVVIPELKNAKSLSHDQQKHLEGEQILRQLQPSDRLVLLDERGAELSSTELAQWLGRHQVSSTPTLTFVIGGPYGFSPEVYARANERLAISRLTFSHQMVRLIFVEQLYRAHTILRGEKYHH